MESQEEQTSFWVSTRSLIINAAEGDALDFVYISQGNAELERKRRSEDSH